MEDELFKKTYPQVNVQIIASFYEALNLKKKNIFIPH